MKFIAVFIILLLPVSVLAHGLEPELRADPGTLPGSYKYPFEKLGEWMDVNLLTLSTKKKQGKKLALSSERAAELGALLYVKDQKQKNMDQALARYKYYLESAENMAEVIIFLDGKEILVAEKFEEETRLQEKFLRELQEGGGSSDYKSHISEALIAARVQNKKMFSFMVEKYQFSDADIRKHRIIIGKHLALVREAMQTLKDEQKLKTASDFLLEAEKFQKAGLNIQAYEFASKAKNAVY